MNSLTTSLASAAPADLVQVGQVPIPQPAAAAAGSTTYVHGAEAKSFPVILRSHRGGLVRIPAVRARDELARFLYRGD